MEQKCKKIESVLQTSQLSVCLDPLKLSSPHSAAKTKDKSKTEYSMFSLNEIIDGLCFQTDILDLNANQIY